MMDELFNDWLFGDGCNYNYSGNKVPAVDVTENNDSYVFDMDLPGRSEKDVNVELKDDVLTIESAKEAEKTESNEAKKDEKTEEKSEKDSPKFLLRERRHSDFTRRFTLPADINSDNVKAEFKNGVLTVRIGKTPKAAPKKIEITAA